MPFSALEAAISLWDAAAAALDSPPEALTPSARNRTLWCEHGVHGEKISGLGICLQVAS